MPLDFPTSPTNGQVYDNFYYDSSISAWRNNGSKNGLSTRLAAEETLNAGLNRSGLVPIVPASVAVSSGSASVSSTGAVTFSGVNTLDILGVFSSTYRNYRLVAQTSTTNGSEWQYIQYRTASGVDSSAIYESIYYEANTTGGPGTREWQSAATSSKVWPTGNYFGNASLDIFNPNLVLFTTAIGQTTYVLSSATTLGVIQHSAQVNTAYTGLRINGTGSSGQIQIYGYRN